MSDEAGVAEGAVVAWAEDGRFLVTGDDASVDRFVAALTPERELRIGAAGPVADGLTALSAGAGVVGGGGRYVEVSARHWELLKRQGISDGKGAFLPTLKGSGGNFTENISLKPVGSLKAAAGPQSALAFAALRLAIEEMQEAVEAVARDVADLRRIAETTEVGNLAGLYRVLVNARTQADEAGTISQATWDAIAPHEVTVQQSADRLRALLRRTVDDLPLDEEAGERYAAARRLLDEGTVGRGLKLLVLAEQCRLLWRSLKLDQVRRTEPGALTSGATAAKALLAENAHADQALITSLRDGFSALGKVGPLDGVKLFTRSKLPAAAAEPRGQVNEFAARREQQLDSWAPDPTPTIGDAARQVGAVAIRPPSRGVAPSGASWSGSAADCRARRRSGRATTTRGDAVPPMRT